MPPPHPLRRISTGSLSSLARSTDRSTASPSGLDFLTPAITELADEVATLSSHVGKLNEMHDALGTFNEAFAAYLYALKMNAFCVEWPQVSFPLLSEPQCTPSRIRVGSLLAELTLYRLQTRTRSAECQPWLPRQLPQPQRRLPC